MSENRHPQFWAFSGEGGADNLPYFIRVNRHSNGYYEWFHLCQV